ncbi:hypothetical protein EDF32_1950 [Cellulomonas sp. PhB143]|nr:hypothetical protein EDF32_1950 [Cellulomonas sp. PhB143]
MFHVKRSPHHALRTRRRQARRSRQSLPSPSFGCAYPRTLAAPARSPTHENADRILVARARRQREAPGTMHRPAPGQPRSTGAPRDDLKRCAADVLSRPGSTPHGNVPRRAPRVSAVAAGQPQPCLPDELFLIRTPPLPPPMPASPDGSAFPMLRRPADAGTRTSAGTWNDRDRTGSARGSRPESSRATIRCGRVRRASWIVRAATVRATRHESPRHPLRHTAPCLPHRAPLPRSTSTLPDRLPHSARPTHPDSTRDAHEDRHAMVLGPSSMRRRPAHRRVTFLDRPHGAPRRAAPSPQR